MDWKNAEQYPDYTAWEAMTRVSGEQPDEPDLLDTRGCLLLICAVIKQAVEDRDAALRHLPCLWAQKQLEETEAFLSSGFIRRMTPKGRDRLFDLYRKEMMNR